MQFLCSRAYALALRETSLIRAMISSSLSHAAITFMQIIKRIGVILIWLAGLVFVFAAANKNDPYLISLRGPGNIVLAVASIVAVVLLIRCGYWRGDRRKTAGSAVVPAVAVDVGAQASFELRKRNVLQTEVAQARSLGQHFIVGYSSFPEVAMLAEKGLIAGIYITRHNIGDDGGDAEIRNRGASGQAACRGSATPDRRRRSGGRHRIASVAALDQIAGSIDAGEPCARLRAEKAEEFGRIHGQELAALGVNHNLAPVLDLRPETERNRFDFNTLIGHRAISDDPASSPISRGPMSTASRHPASARR